MQTTPASSQAELSIDCRGLQCPAPILKLADAARQHKGIPALFHVQATDPDFLTDLEAWCRTTKSRLLRSEQKGDVTDVTIALNGAVAPVSRSQPAPRSQTAPRSQITSTRASADASLDDAVDLRGLAVNAAMRKLSGAAGAPGRLRVVADAPEFEARLYAWATASGARLERVLSVGGQTTAEILIEADEEPAAPLTARNAPAAAPAAPAAPAALAAVEAPAGVEIVPRENRATLLVLRNDFETLLSALMVANSSASQGMDVEIYFAFWGINLLRGEGRRPGLEEKRPGLLQRMMGWMMPRGPARQQLSKMHWGGIGKALLGLFMRQRNVLGLPELIQEATKQNVQFVVCTMSMGVMGIQKADLMELPNLSYGGVTSFAEAARRSSFSLVF